MTAEELIIAVTSEATSIPPVAYKLLWGLISLALQRGSGVVQVSMPWLALYTGASRAGIAIAISQLTKYVEVDSTPGKPTTFRLPDSWLPSQGPLFGGDGPITARRPRLPHVRTKAPTPPRMVPGNQATDQAGTGLNTRQVWPDTSLEITPHLPRYQAAPAWNLSSFNGKPREDPRARVESNRIEDSASSAGYLVLVKAFHTVEIKPEQWEDSRILSDSIICHRMNFDSDASASSRRDRKVLARLLAIAPLEDICDSIHELLAEKRPPGKSDMWYFSVLLDRIHGIDHRVTAAYIEQEKSKALSNESRGPLFEDSLLDEVGGKLRRLG